MMRIAAASLVLFITFAARAAITPKVTCWRYDDGLKLTTIVFGYENDGAPTTIPAGPANFVTPPPDVQLQPMTFEAGVVTNAFTLSIATDRESATYRDPDVSWNVAGSVVMFNSALQPQCDFCLCASYPPGAKGPTGEQGPRGLTGVQGPEGPEGPAGETGPEGPEGESGPPGVETGAMGPTGPRGEAGPTGIAGLDGAPGPIGPRGPVGDPGPAPMGAPGPRGEQGAIGAMGPRGPRGPIGPTGPQGERGTQRGQRGPAGAMGPEGAQGPMGVAGPRGEKGPLGDQGPQGPIGAAGLRGETGDRGPVGFPGPAGLEGVAGPDGRDAVPPISTSFGSDSARVTTTGPSSLLIFGTVSARGTGHVQIVVNDVPQPVRIPLREETSMIPINSVIKVGAGEHVVRIDADRGTLLASSMMVLVTDAPERAVRRRSVKR